jgi:hypothetical protein
MSPTNADECDQDIFAKYLLDGNVEALNFPSICYEDALLKVHAAGPNVARAMRCIRGGRKVASCELANIVALVLLVIPLDAQVSPLQNQAVWAEQTTIRHVSFENVTRLSVYEQHRLLQEIQAQHPKWQARSDDTANLAAQMVEKFYTDQRAGDSLLPLS